MNEAALQFAEEHGTEIRLLLPDVVMPGINGRELADRILELAPDIAVLFTSGYTADVIAHHGVLEDGVDFLPKPFTRRKLSRTVRRILDRRASRA